MELLIPGLILVALMVWASTKIKKTAADAFDAESIETDSYSLQKPEGFLHVMGDPEHEFYAYSKEFGEEPNSKFRRATIEIEIIKAASVEEVRDQIVSSAADTRIVRDTPAECELETDETANETGVRALYKVVDARNAVYRLRFATLSEYSDEYQSKSKETLDSFSAR